MFILVAIDKLQKKRAQKEGIKQKKEDNHKPRTSWQNLSEVFTGDHNGSFSPMWLIPTDIRREMILESEYA